MFSLVQIIGYIGLLFNIIAFQSKIHKKMMFFKSANEFFFTIQYIFLGSYTGAAMNSLSILRNIVFSNQINKQKSTKYSQLCFCVSFIIFGIITWQGPISILIIVAKLLTTIAYGIENTFYIRILTLPTSISWLIYNIYIKSYGGTLCEIFTILSLISALIRLDVLPYMRKKKD